MRRVHFCVHGVTAEVSDPGGTQPEVLTALSQDFRPFLTVRDDSTAVEIRIELSGRPWDGPPPAGAWPLFRTRLASAYARSGGRRFCVYGPGAVVEGDTRDGRRFRIHAPPTAAGGAHELAYVALLSAVGESLDRAGLHRVHALGFARAGKGILAVIPSGGGKSALAALARISGRGTLTFHGDENPLLSQGPGVAILHPYPLRIALAAAAARGLGLPDDARVFSRLRFPPKLLYDWDPREIARPVPLRTILIGERVQRGGPSIEPTGRLTAYLALADSLVVGRGVAQMAEHVLRVGAVPGLGRVAWNRARVAWFAAQGARAYRFRLVADARRNHGVLADFLAQTI